MFADDTNLFFTHQDITYLFHIVKVRKHQPMVYFRKNFSNYQKKSKYSLFHKPNQKEYIPRLFPKVIINNYEIKQTESCKF